MLDEVLDFYNDLATLYHLLFEDWDRTIDRQAQVLNSLVAGDSKQPLHILDCACGIGTQAIGFAKNGHRVVGSDVSHEAVVRATSEAALRGVEISFLVSNMISLAEIPVNDFDIVAALDNALPHLSALELGEAVQAMSSKLKPGGMFIASIRDYDKLLSERPTIQQPSFYGEDKNRRIVHQVWDWFDERHYVVHLYITVRFGNRWRSNHFASTYRAVRRSEITIELENAGFREVRWLLPEHSGYYQPLVIARKR